MRDRKVLTLDEAAVIAGRPRLGRQGARRGEVGGPDVACACAVARRSWSLVVVRAARAPPRHQARRAADRRDGATSRSSSISSRTSSPRRHYVQETTVPRRKRVLKSDFLLVRFPGDDSSGTRSVTCLEVDGKPVARASEEPISRSCSWSRRQCAAPRAENCSEAGARYNLLGHRHAQQPAAGRWRSCRPDYRERFRFKLAGLEKKLGPDVRTVQFQEFKMPTSDQGRTEPGHAVARAWSGSKKTLGASCKTELRVGGSEFPTENRHRCTSSTRSWSINVPVEMRDWYPDGSGEIRGVATYGRFRRFQVRTRGRAAEVGGYSKTRLERSGRSIDADVRQGCGTAPRSPGRSRPRTCPRS